MQKQRYIVYDNRTYLPVIVDETARNCARAMDVTVESFRSIASRQRHGKGCKKWTILTMDEVLNYKEDGLAKCG